LSRLLFAAARGARIEPPNAYEYTSVRAVNGKVQSKTYWIARDTESGYIHPEDEHLQYGPISTALRNDALGLPLTGTWWFAQLALHNEGDLHTMSPTERSMFLLLVAEALADEGL